MCNKRGQISKILEKENEKTKCHGLQRRNCLEVYD